MKRKENLVLNVKSLVLNVHLIYLQNWGQSSVAVTQPHCNVHLLHGREIRTRAHDAPLFNVIIPRCEAFKRSVGYFGAVGWNELPPNVRNLNTLLEFKNFQKKQMLSPLSRIQVIR